jgi:hypothetical protein
VVRISIGCTIENIHNRCKIELYQRANAVKMQNENAKALQERVERFKAKVE